jgi:hypothetical protein
LEKGKELKMDKKSDKRVCLSSRSLGIKNKEIRIKKVQLKIIGSTER